MTYFDLLTTYYTGWYGLLLQAEQVWQTAKDEADQDPIDLKQFGSDLATGLIKLWSQVADLLCEVPFAGGAPIMLVRRQRGATSLKGQIPASRPLGTTGDPDISDLIGLDGQTTVSKTDAVDASGNPGVKFGGGMLTVEFRGIAAPGLQDGLYEALVYIGNVPVALVFVQVDPPPGP